MTRKTPRIARMTRRDCVKALAALASSGWMPSALAQNAQSGLTRQQFAALSQSSTGYAFDDPAIASAMLRALVASVGRPTLVKLATLANATPASQLGAALAQAGLTHPAETVVAAFYTGVVDGPKGPIVVSYTQALVWQACAWTKPNSFCGGPTNYWTTAPGTTSS